MSGDGERVVGVHQGVFRTSNFRHAAFLISRGFKEVRCATHSNRGEVVWSFAAEAADELRGYVGSVEERYDAAVQYVFQHTRRR